MPGTLHAPAARPALASLPRLVTSVGAAFHGRRAIVEFAVAALLARGHLLLEDVPGVGKTTLAHALARGLGVGFQRIQFTADLLPSDLVGVVVPSPGGEFEFRPGPLFSSVILADEINRAPPRTQSGLLQAMQEGRVSVEGTVHALPSPFLVVATQNPLDHQGTYPLPESQLDRFLMRLSLGYPEPAAERRILLAGAGVAEKLADEAPALSPGELLALQDAVDEVHVEDDLVDYVLAVVHRTRTDSRIALGVSPRGAAALLRASRARALVDGRDFLTPDDVRHMAVPCLAHRIVPLAGNQGRPRHEVAAALVEECLDTVPVPV
jgi:MoxR-like ATPase